MLDKYELYGQLARQEYRGSFPADIATKGPLMVKWFGRGCSPVPRRLCHVTIVISVSRQLLGGKLPRGLARPED
jgi:hypothetical protein